MTNTLSESEAKLLEAFEAEGGLFLQMPTEAKELWAHLDAAEKCILANILMADLSALEDMKHPKPSQQELEKMKQERMAEMPGKVKSMLKWHSPEETKTWQAQESARKSTGSNELARKE